MGDVGEIVPWAEFVARALSYDEAVQGAVEIDQYCSSSRWVLPAHESLMPDRDAVLRRTENGWLMFARGDHPRFGIYLEPLEAAWGFASPFVTENPSGLVDDFFALLRSLPDWQFAIVTGLPRSSALLEALIRAPGNTDGHRIIVGSTSSRRRASLEGGFTSYLTRRTRNFRYNLKRARRGALARDITFEYLPDCAPQDCTSSFERIVAIEERSWKGPAHAGIQVGRMASFYRTMLPHLARTKSLRLTFAIADGEDVAYHFGGVLGTTYRGLQHSFDRRFADLSLGMLSQAVTLEHVCQEGVSLYDLGQNMDYKSRWGEQQLDTLALFVRR